MLHQSTALQCAVACLQAGGILAYPTEAVYALGCDPFSKESVTRLLAIKQRSVARGLILIAGDWKQVETLVDLRLVESKLSDIFATWPGPITWVFPASSRAPKWICGQHHSVAVRVTAHPVAHALCQQNKGPIVSTSANVTGEPPAKDVDKIKNYFSTRVDYILEGALGHRQHVSEIRDAVTGRVLRPG